MTTATATKSFTLLEVLESEVGAKFKISTDNDLYGTTVIKTETALLNDRTGVIMPLTAELYNSKFRVVSSEKEVTLHDMLVAYEEGKKIRIDFEDKYRFIQKQEVELPEGLKQLMTLFPLQAITGDEVMTMNEILNAKFYIVG